MLSLLCLLLSASLSICVSIGYIPKYKTSLLSSNLRLSMWCSWQEVCSWLTDWHTVLFSHSNSDGESDGRQIPPSLFKTSGKISQFSSTAGLDFHPTAAQQQTPAPSFLLPTSLIAHSFQLSLPSTSRLLFRWLPLVHWPKHTRSTP